MLKELEKKNQIKKKIELLFEKARKTSILSSSFKLYTYLVFMFGLKTLFFFMFYSLNFEEIKKK